MVAVFGQGSEFSVFSGVLRTQLPTYVKSLANGPPSMIFLVSMSSYSLPQFLDFSQILDQFGCGSKLTHQGTAGFSLCFHLLGFQNGYPFFDPHPHFGFGPVW